MQNKMNGRTEKKHFSIFTIICILIYYKKCEIFFSFKCEILGFPSVYI
jgi:hypothetical protein